MSNTRRNKKQNSALALVIISLLVTAAGWIAWTALLPNRDTGVEKVETVGTQLGEAAPDFSLSTLEGETFTLSTHRGKPTIIFFMAYWCGTCVHEAQALTQLKHEYGDAIIIIAIDLDPSSTPESLSQFKRTAGNGDYIWGFDLDGVITNSWRVKTLDTTLILDSDGVVVYRDEYPTNYETFKDVLATLGF
ncbi:MAG TPA: TlpA disulfide reductase family protein [Anaerolineales bacterium]|nr:TlpA disulfide reductase family protein [Anaerolineales bacterium]HRQ93383.1 TlpA disulfide reductase family protein [Anaerolineales bacterium]